MFVRASLYERREENQLDATEWFIALIICSTCFGHLYAHHQELDTIFVLLPHMVCSAVSWVKLPLYRDSFVSTSDSSIIVTWYKFTL
jgi:hypothetical protein